MKYVENKRERSKKKRVDGRKERKYKQDGSTWSKARNRCGDRMRKVEACGKRWNHVYTDKARMKYVEQDAGEGKRKAKMDETGWSMNE
ncbi:hypothetical protein Pcinc_038250 [Petrolisthes cinctipes]|uniref:Uncharacterized protein n=1 Tax=Petrolisthes cinctipes TaxID=88211 RepID=A0AAE1BU61_PETCI|nr:hypothetical protein Pcinc_038250 [Petrolisthes cinctipes]